MHNLDTLNDLPIDTALLDEEEQEQFLEYESEQTHIQAHVEQKLLQADIDGDIQETLPEEMGKGYRRLVQLRSGLAGNQFIYESFGRTPDEDGSFSETAASLMNRSVDRIANSDLPGSVQLSVFLQKIAKNLDPAERNNKRNPYVVLDGNGEFLTYNQPAIQADREELQKLKHTLATSLPADSLQAQTLLREISAFENVLVRIPSIDPVQNVVATQERIMNAKDPIGFVPREAWKTMVLALAALWVVTSIINKKYLTAGVVGLLALWYLYGNKENMFGGLKVLGNKELQPHLVSLANSGDPKANAEMFRILTDTTSSDRKQIDAWVKKGRIPDEEVESIENATLREALTSMPDSKDRLQWLYPFLEVHDKNAIEVAAQYIESKGQPPPVPRGYF
jgi:hypothetical protein